MRFPRPKRKYTYDDQAAIVHRVEALKSEQGLKTKDAVDAAGIDMRRFVYARKVVANGRSLDDVKGSRLES